MSTYETKKPKLLWLVLIGWKADVSGGGLGGWRAEVINPSDSCPPLHQWQRAAENCIDHPHSPYSLASPPSLLTAPYSLAHFLS